MVRSYALESGKHDETGKNKENHKRLVICTRDTGLHVKWHKLGYWEQMGNTEVVVCGAATIVSTTVMGHQ
jgi:hypothetical protein